MSAEDREMLLAAYLTEILDEYLDFDWRSADLKQMVLTQSTCLIRAAYRLRLMELENVTFV